MTAGDPADWDDLFAQQLIPTVLALVTTAWTQSPKPTLDELEDHISIRLVSEMLKGKDRQRHLFLIDFQSVEIDTDLAKEIGRKDIIFRPSIQDEDVYFCLEAKRLNIIVNSRRKSLADEYVKDGMQRYVDRKYSPRVCHGGMLGYVLDGDVPRAMSLVIRNIRNNHVSLRMKPPGDWIDSLLCPGNPHVKETQHSREHESTPFRIHHLFVGKPGDGSPRKTATRGKRPSAKKRADKPKG
jgi:hypothetical protein